MIRQAKKIKILNKIIFERSILEINPEIIDSTIIFLMTFLIIFFIIGGFILMVFLSYYDI